MSALRHRKRQRLVGLVPAVALASAAVAGLALLFFRAGDPRRGVAQSSPDWLTVAYLQAMVDRHPGDVETRRRLARAQLALGSFRDADRTLAPVLGAEAAAEPQILAVDAAAAAWRAAPTGSPERATAAARTLERLERLLDQDPEPEEFDHLAKVARELGRNDLAARAHENAAALDRSGCARWLSEAARDYFAAGDQRRAAGVSARAYACSRSEAEALAAGVAALDAALAADMAEDAMQLADRLVERFPSEAAVLQRAEAIALGRNDPGRARRFGERLMELGVADPVTLGRQLDLELAAGDLAAAVRVAERAAARAPHDPSSRLTAARVATWAGRPELALRHWTWLARRGQGPESLDQALGLARALGDASAVADLLTMRSSRKRALSPADLAELGDALEKAGPPGSAAAALQAYARRHPGRRDALEQLAAFRERDGDLAASAAVREDISRRFGASLASSVQLARLEWRLGRPRDALAELRRWTGSAGPGEADYWSLLAELAWDEEADDLAGRAYRALWDGDEIDAVGAERLLLLSRGAGRSADVIRYGREGWARTHQPRLLLLAMDQAAREGRWGDLGRMAGEAARAPSAFAAFPSYWSLRARLAERAGRVPDAVEAYRQALAADPRSSAARSGVIWLLAGAGDRQALQRCLAAWEVDAWNDPALWRAYAAGLEKLGRRREALAFYRREALATTDAGAVRRFADALGRAGERAAADRLDAFLAGRGDLPAPGAPAPWAAAPGEGGPAGEPDEVEVARPGSGRFRSAGAAIEGEARVVSMGPVVLRQERAVARSEVQGTDVEARVALTGFGSRRPDLRMPGEETEVLARLSFPALGGWNEVTGGASLRADGNRPRAGLSHARDLASSTRARLEASLDEPADESAALRVGAVGARRGGARALAGGALYRRARPHGKRWSTRAGAALGTGGAATLEAGWLARGVDLDLRAWLQCGYQRNQAAFGPAGDALAAFSPGATALLPPELAVLGLGAGVARWAVGPARVLADGWVGWIWPPARPAFRADLGVSIAPFANGELSLAGFAATDRWNGGGDHGVSLALTWGSSR